MFIERMHDYIRLRKYLDRLYFIFSLSADSKYRYLYAIHAAETPFPHLVKIDIDPM